MILFRWFRLKLISADNSLLLISFSIVHIIIVVDMTQTQQVPTYHQWGRPGSVRRQYWWPHPGSCWPPKCSCRCCGALGSWSSGSPLCSPDKYPCQDAHSQCGIFPERGLTEQINSDNMSWSPEQTLISNVIYQKKRVQACSELRSSDKKCFSFPMPILIPEFAHGLIPGTNPIPGL